MYRYRFLYLLLLLSHCSLLPSHGPLFLHSKRRRRRLSCSEDYETDNDSSDESDKSECDDRRRRHDVQECWAEIARLKKKLGELSRKMVTSLEEKVDKTVYNVRIDKEGVFFKSFGNAIHLTDSNGVEFDYKTLGVTITEGDESAGVTS